MFSSLGVFRFIVQSLRWFWGSFLSDARETEQVRSNNLKAMGVRGFLLRHSKQSNLFSCNGLDRIIKDESSQ